MDEVGLGDGLSVPGGAGAEVEDSFRSVGEFRGGSFGDHRSGLAEKGETLRFARIIFLFVRLHFVVDEDGIARF